MRERHRLKLARRQLLLAGIARREAMGALASAIENETRSAALADHSRELASQYREDRDHLEGFEMRDLARFSGALSSIASEAERSRRDAGKQAAVRQQSLTTIENRTKRLEEREKSARREFLAAIERVSNDGDERLARKLHKQNPQRSLRRVPAAKQRRPQ